MSEDKVAKALGDYWTAQETGANWGNSVAGAAGASAYKPPSKKTSGGGGGGGGGGPDGCFPAGTRIATPHGKLAIEKLQSGGRVFSFNEKKELLKLIKYCKLKSTQRTLFGQYNSRMERRSVRQQSIHSLLMVNGR